MQSTERAPRRRPARTSRRFNLTSAILAFVLWSGWAYFVNGGPSTEGHSSAPMVSALTQGTGSFIITLIMVRLVSWIYHLLPVHSARIVSAALITVSITGSCLATAHAVVGTPEIVSTIAPALAVAFFFNVYTASMLRRDKIDPVETERK